MELTWSSSVLLPLGVGWGSSLGWAAINGPGLGPGGLWPGLALQGGWHNLRRQVEEVSQVLDTLVGQVPVVVAPGELFLDVATGLQ